MDQTEQLIAALRLWAEDCEGQPRSPADAHLLKALIMYEGEKGAGPHNFAELCADMDAWAADWYAMRAEQERRALERAKWAERMRADHSRCRLIVANGRVFDRKKHT